MASFERVNYALRTNKNVERKLIFEALEIIGGQFSIAKYRYLGFGAMWFVDFLIAHKVLGISDLISIEKDPVGYTRAKFNKPFSCVEVEKGESTQKIPDLELGDAPLVAWLDYDSDIDGPVLDDIELLCSIVPSGSVVLATVNAHEAQLNQYVSPQYDRLAQVKAVVDDEHVSDSDKVHAVKSILDKAPISKAQQKRDALEAIAPGLVPHELSRRDLRGSEFPKLVARILLNKFNHSMRVNGREEQFYPLFNIFYQDGAPMVTVGGMIASASDARLLQRSRVRLKKYVTGERQYRVTVPPLTIKEKLALDQLLPKKRNLSVSAVKREHKFELDQEQLSAYQKFYRYYPMYGELDF